MKTDISKFTTFKDFKKQSLSYPQVKKEYDLLGPRYQIINQLIQARIKKGLTQKEIATRMGTKQSALARFESGNSNPTLKFIQKLAKALDTTFNLTIS